MASATLRPTSLVTAGRHLAAFGRYWSLRAFEVVRKSKSHREGSMSVIRTKDLVQSWSIGSILVRRARCTTELPQTATWSVSFPSLSSLLASSRSRATSAAGQNSSWRLPPGGSGGYLGYPKAYRGV